MHSNIADISKALLAVVKGDFTDWNGLPAGVTTADIEAVWGVPLRGLARGFLGQAVRAVNYSVAELPDFTFPPHVWFEGKRIVMIRIEFPKLLTSPEQMKQALGVEPQQLNFHWGGMLVNNGLWAFPEIGVAVYCNPEHDKIVKIDLFPAIDRKRYIDEYYFDEVEIEDSDV